MKPKNLPRFYEWVLVPWHGENAVLTETQYEFYKKQVMNGDMSTLFFDDFEVHPAQVASAYKREAFYIKQKYPCAKCNTNGFLRELDKEGFYKLCDICGGTGVDWGSA